MREAYEFFLDSQKTANHRNRAKYSSLSATLDLFYSRLGGIILDTAMVPEEHRHRRNRVRWPVSVFTAAGKVKGETENINSTGISVSCQEELPRKGILHVVVKLPNGQKVKASATVACTTSVSVDKGLPRLGTEIQFTRIFKNDNKFLRSVIAMHYAEKTSRTAKRQMSKPQPSVAEERRPINALQAVEVQMPVFYNKGRRAVKACGRRFSTKGCHIFTKVPPPGGSVFTLIVKNPWTNQSIRLNSSVVQCKHFAATDNWGTMLRFMDVTETDKREFRQILVDAATGPRQKQKSRHLGTKIGQAVLSLLHPKG